MIAESLQHMTADQREAYASRMERMAGNKRGSIADHLRNAAEIARAGGESSFYSGVPGRRV